MVKLGGNFCFSTINFPLETLMAAASDTLEVPSKFLTKSDGFGAEISYQRLLSRYHRLELNLGWRDSREYDAFKVTGLYEWVRHIDGNFNWFYGAGAGFGSASFEPVPDDVTPDGGFFVLVAGNVGVEYNFDIPLLLSFDIRPELGILGYNDFSDNFDFDVALGIRYQF